MRVVGGARFTFEVIVWVCCMELTLQVRANSAQHATDYVRGQMGRSGRAATIVGEARRIDGATSATFLSTRARLHPSTTIPALIQQ